MHMGAGEISAYLDGGLTPAGQQQVKQHLQDCARCQGLAEALQSRRQWIGGQISLLEGNQDETPSLQVGRARLEARRNFIDKEQKNMFKQTYKRVPRLAWIGLALALLLVVSLTFPPVRAIANSFLGLFRVQNIRVVQVNPGALPEQLGSSAQFESMLSQDVQFQENGEAQQVASPAEASDLAGFAVRLPDGIETPVSLLVQPGGSAAFIVNLARAQALLSEIGRADISIPEGLDGAQVVLDMPTSVVAQFGQCEFDPEVARQQGYDPDSAETPILPQCTTLIQMPSPTISAPPGLDMQKIGEAYLQVMGMSREEAERFASQVDWATTLAIPLPRYADSYQEAPVDGVNGTLMINTSESGASQYMLLWVKGDMVYALTGPGDSGDALAIANSLS